jgi:hypothetical protein
MKTLKKLKLNKFFYSKNIIEKLKERKLYYASTNQIENILDQNPKVGIYAGFYFFLLKFKI